MSTIIDAILVINPDAKCSVSNEEIEGIVWKEGTIPISKKDIQSKQKELQAEYDAQEYARKRQVEYPSIQECIHAILDDELVTLQEKRTAVKIKYPKE